MSAPTVTPREVEAVVDSFTDQFASAYPPAAVAIHARPSWDGPDTLRVNDVEFEVVPCVSVLAARAALVDAQRPVVLLTEHDKHALGVDLCARLAGGRPRNSDRRDAVKQAFGAHQLDPRLSQERWLVDELLAAVPPTGYPKVVGGLLTRDHALRTLASIHLGLVDLAPPPAAFLAWADQEETRAQVRKAPDRVVDRIFGDVLPAAVPFAQEVLEALQSQPQRDLVALGLVAGVIARSDGAQAAAAGALFRSRIGDRRLGDRAGEAWGDAAAEVLSERIASDLDIESTLQRAEELLEEVEAVELAAHNDYLRTSFRKRLDAHGVALMAVLAGTQSIDTLHETLANVRGHRLAAIEARRFERVEMSVRLAQWLTQDTHGTPSSLAESGLWYRNEGGWVDYARRTLTDTEAEPNLAFAYEQLLTRTTEKRAHQNQAFGQQLSGWDQSDSPSVLGVEQVLDQAVAPLAEVQPVLVLVMDGMGWDVWHQLRIDLARRGWTRIIDDEHTVDRPCYAVFPTVTEHSRTSLLTGRLNPGGDQNDEKKEFAAHAALLAASKKGKPPALFHKGELSRSDRGGLAEGLADMIADPEQRVVGCVVNAIDDHLLKGDQVRPDWTIETISPLGLLIDRAQYAQRAVVVTADHGHVLDIDSEARVITGAKERWRPDNGDLADDEVRIHGPRTLEGDGTVVMPWAEQLRYSSGRRNGYHGGATPQEVLVPVDVLINADPPTHWTSAEHRVPAWWTLGITQVENIPVEPTPVSPPPEPPEDQTQPTLFSPEPVSTTAVSWIDQLLVSEVLVRQRERSGPRPISDERLSIVLAALAGNGGRLTYQELAAATGLPLGRIRGLIASAVRVLNVDGYGVLDDDGELVTLDIHLTKSQFGLD